MLGSDRNVQTGNSRPLSEPTSKCPELFSRRFTSQHDGTKTAPSIVALRMDIAMKHVWLSALLATVSFGLVAAPEPARAEVREPYGIGLEGFAYPYPVQMLPLLNDGEQVRMAYMDVQPAKPNGRTVVLLHGRNFPSGYWGPVFEPLGGGGVAGGV